jgi:hypothetical protein
MNDAGTREINDHDQTNLLLHPADMYREQRSARPGADEARACKAEHSNSCGQSVKTESAGMLRRVDGRRYLHADAEQLKQQDRSADFRQRRGHDRLADELQIQSHRRRHRKPRKAITIPNSRSFRSIRIRSTGI